MGTVVAKAKGHSASLQVKRPRFKDVWAAYPVGMAAGDVYKLVGGQAYELYQANPRDYANACALRLSRAFNYGGLTINSGGKGYKLRGDDKKAYLLRVGDMINFVKEHLGKPDFAVNTKGEDRILDFVGRRGILIFTVSGWNDASGHVTLWNGGECGDHCYFTHPNQPRTQTTEIQFWELR